jgi:hypothetical protein
MDYSHPRPQARRFSHIWEGRPSCKTDTNAWQKAWQVALLLQGDEAQSSMSTSHRSPLSNTVKIFKLFEIIFKFYFMFHDSFTVNLWGLSRDTFATAWGASNLD